MRQRRGVARAIMNRLIRRPARPVACTWTRCVSRDYWDRRGAGARVGDRGEEDAVWLWTDGWGWGRAEGVRGGFCDGRADAAAWDLG